MVCLKKGQGTQIMSKKKKSRVLVAGICISTLLSPVAFEASKGYAAPLEENKGGSLEKSKENKFEQRVFQLPGKGSIEAEKERLKYLYEFSPNEPTGIYVEPNEEITIEIKGNQSIKAFIGTHSYDKEAPKEFDLKPGKNTISSPNGGILYFYNLNDTGEVTATVTNGGSHFPLFILGKHTKKDWDEMLEKYKKPYAVELKGERSLITAGYDKVQKYMEKKELAEAESINPIELMKAHDKAIRIEGELSGLSENGTGMAKSAEHYTHFIEAKYPRYSYMYATSYYTGYAKESIEYVLDLEKFKNDGWGPWHEVGHLHQQQPWEWKGMEEVIVNIYSLAVQTSFGNPSRMEVDGRYEEAFEYLNKPNGQKDFDSSDPIVMFWQLHLIYGDQFYPKLHQMYRVLSDKDYPMLDNDNGISDREKKQMFIYIASKIAGQNLISYFDKWGLYADPDTVEKVSKLQLPEPKNEIWLSRDSAPIRETQVKPYKVPYGEPVSTVPDILIGTEFDEKKASELVKNLGENVKVTGKIVWSKYETGKQIVNVEIMDEEGNVNAISVPVNVSYGDSLLVYGLSYGSDDMKSIITLHHDTKKMSATDTDNLIHDYFKNEKYFGFTLYNKEGKEKKNIEVKGLENTKAFAKEVNGLAFEYGDVVKVYHAESSRLHWYQKGVYAGEGKSKEIKEVVFKITENGFERFEGEQTVQVHPKKVVIGTDVEKLEVKDFVQVKDGEVIGFVEKPNTTKIGEQKVKVETKDRFGNKKVTEVPLEVTYGDSLLVHGLSYGGDDMKSIITLHHDTKKMSATDTDNLIHDYFKDEKYFEFTLYNKDGKEKKSIAVKGLENTKVFAKEVNGLAFEYGDVLKVYHAESSRLHWYQKGVYAGEGKNKEIKELLFKITENGFERLESEQTVQANPQKVVIGTDAEKLNAKDFVQIKDGEVIGFVEKPITTKIGEQKVKVETKDCFGNKKVTEVTLEVIYGDSIMFFGTSYGGSNIKSVVTLNHEEKKFSTTGAEGSAHTSFKDQKYIGMTVYDKDGKEKKEVSVKGSENTKGFAEQFNGMTFEYGDMVKVYQKEFDRFKVYKKNELVNAQYGVHEVIFKVTEQGFERVEARQEVTAVPQKVVIGTDVEKLEVKDFVQVKDGEVIGFVEKPITTKIGEQKVKVETRDRFGNKQVTEVPLEVTYGDSLLVYGLSYGGDDMKSIVTLHHDAKKMSATDTSNLIHDYFEDEKYFEFTLYNKEGKEKKNIEVKGLESTEAFAKEVNGLAFEYGDVVKVYHAESSRLHWYQKGVYVGEGKNKEIKELVFKITENGFERSEAEQTVQANPQKVVIGTNADKLDAKNFVQVKDGEVIGFVEKPNTTKIGEQKVKVETKDRFGNKKVTEVLMEVTYGDSVVYQGVSNVTRSIVTLNHAEKKLHATFTNEEIHYRFVNEQYIGLTIYDQNGKEKKHVTAEGQETSKNFAGQVNGTAFEYGDVLKVYHAEPSRLNWYKKNELVKKEDAMKGQEISFKITQNGLEQVQ